MFNPEHGTRNLELPFGKLRAVSLSNGSRKLRSGFRVSGFGGVYFRFTFCVLGSVFFFQIPDTRSWTLHFLHPLMTPEADHHYVVPGKSETFLVPRTPGSSLMFDHPCFMGVVTGGAGHTVIIKRQFYADLFHSSLNYG
jgi:hypothetical protein